MYFLYFLRSENYVRKIFFKANDFDERTGYKKQAMQFHRNIRKQGYTCQITGSQFHLIKMPTGLKGTFLTIEQWTVNSFSELRHLK